MDDIQPFIDLGWHTVPLEGQLTRLEDGSKTTPVFPKNWKSRFATEFNTSATKIGGTITGSISNIIAIDCDDQITYNIFAALDPKYSFHFISKGKPKGGGTIVYEFPDAFELPTFSIHDDTIQLDFYAEKGFIYLPTVANTTKQDFSMVPLKKPPKEVTTLLIALHTQYALSKGQTVAASRIPVQQTYFHLAPLVELLVNKVDFIPALFKVLTPKDFRDEHEYIQKGWLHPKNVPAGRGSEYLSKVSAILGADISIDTELYKKAILVINDMWATPMPYSRLEATVIKPMVSGSAQIDGEAIWQYDENWQLVSTLYTTKIGETLECFYDEDKQYYFILNHTSDTVTYFDKPTEFYNHLSVISQNAPPLKDLRPSLPLVRTMSNPALPYGFYTPDEYTKQFNLFKATPALSILADPSKYRELYSRPVTTINYFNSLVPDPDARNYLLGFIKTKLLTFSYSPVVLYFLGRSGTGKDTFVNILSAIIGDSYIARPSAREFLEHFNSWILDKYFIQLDEYGDQLTKFTDKQETVGKLKAYTGKEVVQIRRMRTDAYQYKHSITFIMTANRNPLLIDEDDRRVALFSTPNPLQQEDWVSDMGGIAVVMSRIFDEINDFCYYLATEVTALTMDEYSKPPSSLAKDVIIANSLTPGPKLIYIIKKGLANMMEDLIDEHDSHYDKSTFSLGRIYYDDLVFLYSAITGGSGNDRVLSMLLKNAEIDKVPTTRSGKKAYYIDFPELTALKQHSPFNQR